MEPRIETLKEKKLIGTCLKMSFANNRTAELWRSFMPHRAEINNRIGEKLYSLEVYAPDFFAMLRQAQHDKKIFDPHREFEKWAAVEVADFESVPTGMQTLIVPGGLYAVFLHIGPASEGEKTYRYIFTDWLPKSDYEVDTRPHFAVMGEKYKNDHPSSEEDIWIPIRSRSKSV